MKQHLKAVQIELPADLHAAVKAKAAQLNIPLYQAYGDALDRWVSESNERSFFTLEQTRRLFRFFHDPKNIPDKMLGDALRKLIEQEYS